MEGYLSSLAARGLVPPVIGRVRRALELLARWLEKPVAEAAPTDLERYRLHLIETRTPYAAFRDMEILTTCFGWLLARAEILCDPTLDLRPMKRPPVRQGDVLTPEEVLLLRDRIGGEPRGGEPRGGEPRGGAPPGSLDLRDRAMLLVLFGAALRRFEVARLDVTDYDRLGGTLRVREGKGRKDRVVPLWKRSVGDLEAYLKEGRPALARKESPPRMFLSFFGGAINRAAVHYLVRRVRGAIPGKRIGTHTFRRSAATHLLRQGVDPRLVQEFLGHGSITSTQRYIRLDAGDLREAVESLSGAVPSLGACWPRA